MQHIGHPEKTLRVIHVAGTSGKTSTCYFIRGLLEAAGQKTGLTVSPHIVAINERVQIGGVPLAEPVFVRYLNEFLALIDNFADKPTYFELVMAFALWVFAQERVDYAVVETGLGGLLDATNVLERADKICALTAIGFDHTEILGRRLSDIAYQKVGIVHPGNVMFTVRQSRTVMTVFRRQVDAVGAKLVVIPEPVPVNDVPTFHYANWALAEAVYESVRLRDGLRPLAADAGTAVRRQTPPARFEIYHVGDKTVIIDGAHNPQKLRACIDSLPADVHGTATVVLSLVSAPSYKIAECLEIIAPLAETTLVTSFAVGQDLKLRSSVGLAALAEAARAAGCRHVESHADAVAAVDRALTLPNPTIIIVGSLYLASIVRPAVIAAARPD